MKVELYLKKPKKNKKELSLETEQSSIIIIAKNQFGKW